MSEQSSLSSCLHLKTTVCYSPTLLFASTGPGKHLAAFPVPCVQDHVFAPCLIHQLVRRHADAHLHVIFDHRGCALSRHTHISKYTVRVYQIFSREGASYLRRNSGLVVFLGSGSHSVGSVITYVLTYPHHRLSAEPSAWTLGSSGLHSDTRMHS